MGMLMIIMVLSGFVLGQYFRVYAVVPATAVAVACVVGFGATHEQGALPIILNAIGASAGLQFGYIMGLALHRFFNMSRLVHLRKELIPEWRLVTDRRRRLTPR
jgi:hypothetical protein